MPYANSSLKDANTHRTRRTICNLSYWSATLLACASCSSDMPPPDGGSGASGYSGSEVSAGTSNHAGAAGHAGSTHGGAAGSGGSPSAVGCGDPASTTQGGCELGGAGGATAVGGSDAVGGTGTSAGTAGMGTSGGANGAGSGGAGTSDAGGASGTAGVAGIEGTAGSGGAGTGGADAGGTGNAGGTADAGGTGNVGGAISGASGTAGTGGVGGAVGGASGVGGGSGTGGAQSNSFTVSSLNPAYLTSNCPFTFPNAIIITNTSNGPLTWHLSGDFTKMDVSPLGSTLPLGGTVGLSVTPKWGVKQAKPVVSIDADGAPSQSVTIDIYMTGFFVNPPVSDIDFGNVPVGFTGASVFIPLFGSGLNNVTGVHLFAGGYPDFQLSPGGSPGAEPGGFGWTLTFRSQTPGPQQTTLSVGTPAGTVCPPSTFVARATAVAP